MNPFLYPLKISENRKVFWCFQWVEKGCIGNKWVNSTFWDTERNTSLEYRRMMFVWLGILHCKGALEKRIKTDIVKTKWFFYTSIKRKDLGANSATAGKYWIRVRDCLQISLLIICEFKRLVNFYSPENHRFFDDFRGIEVKQNGAEHWKTLKCTLWRLGVVVITTALLHLSIAWFTSCSRHVGDSWWWESLTMVLARNKAKRLSPVNHTIKTIHHPHYHHHHHHHH